MTGSRPPLVAARSRISRRTESLLSTRTRIEPLSDASYRAPCSPSSAEISIKGSRFKAVLLPVTGSADASAKLEERHNRYASASHVCWAWRLGSDGSPRSSDAGEPSGTAGRPILQALESAGVSDALLVVARWFGGTKLGRGGLIRAYGGAARLVLGEAQLTIREPTAEVRFTTDYATWDAVDRLVASLHGTATAEFGERVRGRIEIRAADRGALRERLADLGVQIDG